MANKKLKVELEVDTQKAKRTVKRELGGTDIGSPPTGPSGTDTAAKSIRDLGNAAKDTQYNMKSCAKAFSGMAVGLAASYAANNVQNPTARAGLEYGGAALSGASMGAMVGGPIGAVVGGLGGVLKNYLEKSGERAQMSKDFEKSEEIYAATERDREKFRSLTDVHKGGGTAAQLPQLREIAGNFGESAKKIAEMIREELQKANPDKERIADLQRNLGYSRQQQKLYEGAAESIELRGSGERAASVGGVDALSRIGGGFGSSDGMSAMKRLSEEGNRILKDIARNTKEGAAWQ